MTLHRSSEDTRGDEQVEVLVKRIHETACELEVALLTQTMAIEENAKRTNHAQAAFDKAMDELRGLMGSKRWTNRR